jgi:hypothetical protein
VLDSKIYEAGGIHDSIVELLDDCHVGGSGPSAVFSMLRLINREHVQRRFADAERRHGDRQAAELPGGQSHNYAISGTIPPCSVPSYVLDLNKKGQADT